MGYADGYYYGQGRIICDTSTFSVGDTIRVRSMTDSSKVWNQQVATVGTALVFTVPCYDYYKICTVQNNTEIGGIYKTVDYGQTLFINALDKTTLGGIQGILNAHQESSLLAIGDEVDINIGGSDVTFQIGGIDLYDSHEVIFVAKELYMQSAFNSVVNDKDYTESTALRPNVQGIYSQINANDRAYIKDITKSSFSRNGSYYTFTDKIWIPSQFEFFGSYPYGSPTIQQHQFPLFITQANRIKTWNGTSWGYWTTDHMYNSNNCMGVKDDGSLGYWLENNTTVGVLPCFHLTADS